MTNMQKPKCREE